MQEDKKNKIGFVDPKTGEVYSWEAEMDIFQNGETWGAKVNITTSKTQLVLFELARYVASHKEGEPGVSDARQILQTVYQKLLSFTIEEAEDASGFRCHWQIKEGLRAAAIEEEMRGIINSPMFKAVVRHVFKSTKAAGDIDVKVGGGGVRVGAHWTKARFAPEKKNKRKPAAGEMQFEFALMKLLKDVSTHRDKEHPLYLLGNGGEDWTEVTTDLNGRRVDEKMRVAVIEAPPAAFYKAYTGKPSAKISKGERERVEGFLKAGQEETETIYIKEMQTNGRVKWIEIARPKLTLDKIADLTEEEAEAREAGGELPEGKTVYRIRLNPVFTYNIQRKYAHWPDDYILRMKALTGDRRSADKYWLLNEYLNGIRGHRLETPLDFETLVQIMDLARFKKKQGAPATAAEIKEAIDLAKQIGLVLSYEIKKGSKGQDKYEFKLNPDFSKD